MPLSSDVRTTIRARGSDDRRLRALVDERLFGGPAPPTAIDRYRVTGRIGAGAMGVVYLAIDEQLGRQVAVKLLHRHVASDAALGGDARLLREARALARLDHPNVVRVYEVGAHQGQIYVAMEYVEGVTLGQWLAQAPRSWAAIIDVMLGAGRGLAAIHAAGLVHRDLKPDNIVVDRRGHPRILDLGLVRPHEPLAGDDAAPLTRSGVIVGTMAYMAPEQLRGEPAAARSDVFAFSVVTWEALFGRRPFELLRSGDGAPSLQRPPAAARVPMRLRRLLLRGLAWQPSRRIASMDRLLAELERIREHRSRWPLMATGLAGAAAAALVSMAPWRSATAVERCPQVDAAAAWEAAWVAVGDAGAPDDAVIVGVAADGRRAFADARGGLWIVDPAGGATWTLAGHRQVVRAVAFLGAAAVVSAGDDGAVLRWSLAEGVGARIFGASRPVVALSREGDALVVGVCGGEVVVLPANVEGDEAARMARSSTSPP